MSQGCAWHPSRNGRRILALRPQRRELGRSRGGHFLLSGGPVRIKPVALAELGEFGREQVCSGICRVHSAQAWRGSRSFVGDHLVGQPDQGGKAAGRSRTQPDPDAMPGGKPADHEKAHPAGDRNVDHGRIVQPPVGMRHLLGAHADTLVSDVDQDSAAVQEVAGDVDGRVGRR